MKNILEANVRIVLVCPRKHKPERGDKTDFRDARRKKLQGNLCAEKNRIQKVLDVANVKIGDIVSDMFGISGQAMVSVWCRERR